MGWCRAYIGKQKHWNTLNSEICLVDVDYTRFARFALQALKNAKLFSLMIATENRRSPTTLIWVWCNPRQSSTIHLVPSSNAISRILHPTCPEQLRCMNTSPEEHTTKPPQTGQTPFSHPASFRIYTAADYNNLRANNARRLAQQRTVWTW